MPLLLARKEKSRVKARARLWVDCVVSCVVL
jgi:hypothetical protein